MSSRACRSLARCTHCAALTVSLLHLRPAQVGKVRSRPPAGHLNRSPRWLARSVDAPLVANLTLGLIVDRIFDSERRALVTIILADDGDAREPGPAVHPAPSAELGKASADKVNVDTLAFSDDGGACRRTAANGRRAPACMSSRMSSTQRFVRPDQRKQGQSKITVEETAGAARGQAVRRGEASLLFRLPRVGRGRIWTDRGRTPGWARRARARGFRLEAM